MAFNPANHATTYWDDPNAPLAMTGGADDQVFAAPGFDMPHLDDGTERYPVYDNSLGSQVTAHNLNNHQSPFVNGDFEQLDGLASWGSHDSTVTASVAASMDGSWQPQESLAGSDYSSMNQDQPSVDCLGQLPEFMMQQAPESTNPRRPKLYTYPPTSSTADNRAIGDDNAGNGKKDHSKSTKKGKSNQRKASTAAASSSPMRPPKGPASGSKGKKPQPATRAVATQSRSRKRSRPQLELEVDSDDPSQRADEDNASDGEGEADDLQDGDDVDGDGHGSKPMTKTQRERNRMAATKCRAKTKAAMTQLEEDNKLVSENNGNLQAQVATLRSQVVDLRTKLLEHGDCDWPPIQNYIQNAATLIGEHGGLHPIWGPDGRGGEWTEYSPNASAP